MLDKQTRDRIRAERDAQARQAQPAYDEVERALNDAFGAGSIFDTVSRHLMRDANLGLAISAAYQEEQR